MLNLGFVAALALGLFALVVWGVRTLPAERWQMLAAVPIAKSADGSWRGLNLTFYGFFSATGTAFGLAIALLLLASVGISVAVSIALVIAGAVDLRTLVPGDRRPGGAQAQHVYHGRRSLRRDPRLSAAGAGPAAAGRAAVLHRGIPVLPIFRRGSHRLRAGRVHWTAGLPQLWMLLRHAFAPCQTCRRAALSQAQPGDPRRDQEGGLCFRAGLASR